MSAPETTTNRFSIQSIFHFLPYVIPIIAFVVLVVEWNTEIPVLLGVITVIVLASAVLASVHHAEVVAHKVGEPFGSVILAVAVTVIEVGMIIMLMMSSPESGTTLARDTVFAATMITTNLIIGLSLVAATGGRKLAYFNKEGSGTAFSTVLLLAVSTLVFPSVTVSSPEGVFTTSQLLFFAVLALLIWVLFVVAQTRRHRDFFLPITKRGEIIAPDKHADPPTTRTTIISLVLLIVSLVSVVGLAKVLSKPIEEVVATAGLPEAFVGIVIAMLVLMPETIAAYKNARAGRTQIALNLGYGSAIASIGLTIPVVGIIAVGTETPIVLGLDPMHLVFLALTAALSILTIVQGRALRIQGTLHLVVGFAYIFLVAVP
ncbi:MAG: hypothetical protein PUK40_03890 [Actinomycetaceae bacterium]|nr:hypothetical protein [Arcanobacterium sp.]MDD7505079.1 hypothetical protein [Actinomycetaceae bacterium]MDY6142596.1 hypothetical protein [Arcanobacterium sp.]